MQKIENEYLSVEINEKGAELFSIKSKKTGVEYLWQGNPEYWGGRAPILFPICGRLFEGKYIYNQKEYEMLLHGFARKSTFETKTVSSEQIELTLKANEDTKKCYPFDFELVIRYALKSNILKTEFIIKNVGDKEMFFSYGGHPGFNVPFMKDEKFEDYYVEFSKNQLVKQVFSDSCLCTGKTKTFDLNNKKLKLSHDLFDNDALFFEAETDKVKLKNVNNKNSVEIMFKDMTLVGLWHKPKTDAPFICIEPWHGIPAYDGVVDNLEEKNQILKLSPNKKHKNSYAIKIIEG